MASGNFVRGLAMGFQMGNQIQQSAMQREMFELQKQNYEPPDVRRAADIDAYEQKILMAEEAAKRQRTGLRQENFEANVDLYGWRPQVPGMSGMEPNLPGGKVFNPNTMASEYDPLWLAEAEARIGSENATTKQGGGGGYGKFSTLSQNEKSTILKELDNILAGYSLEGITWPNVPEDVINAAYGYLRDRVMYDDNNNPVPIEASPARAASAIYAWVVSSDEQVQGFLNKLDVTVPEHVTALENIQRDMAVLVERKEPVENVRMIVKHHVITALESGVQEPPGIGGQIVGGLKEDFLRGPQGVLKIVSPVAKLLFAQIFQRYSPELYKKAPIPIGRFGTPFVRPNSDNGGIDTLQSSQHVGEGMPR